MSYDTGLKALREMLGIPVVGMTEAALLTACMLGGPIGLVGFGKRVWPIYRELIEGYGLAARIAGKRVLENTAAARITLTDKELQLLEPIAGQVAGTRYPDMSFTSAGRE